ncbi:MAG: hypothetical protein VB996_17540, partial [Pseudomonadales bacterium]
AAPIPGIAPSAPSAPADPNTGGGGAAPIPGIAPSAPSAPADLNTNFAGATGLRPVDPIGVPRGQLEPAIPEREKTRREADIDDKDDNAKGSNSSELKRATSDNATSEDFSIIWGKWNRSIDSNWGIVTQVNDSLTVVSTSKYFAEVNPTPVANLKGNASYGSGLASSFIGSGSAGEISSLLAAMDVNFDTGTITNGNLQINVTDQAWAVDFIGSVNAGVVGLGVTAAQLIDSSGLVSTSINANLGGLFTGSAAEIFVGGFDLQDLVNPLNSVEGIYTINR